MATYTLSQARNWSNIDGASHAPTTGDIVNLNGYALTLDGGNSATYTCATIQARASNGTTETAGNLVPGTSTPFTINANLYAGLTNALLTIASAKSCTINGNVYGGNYAGAAMTGKNCVVVSSGGTLTLNGSAYGGGNFMAQESYGVASSGTLAGTIPLTQGGLVRAGIAIVAGSVSATITKAQGGASIFGGLSDVGSNVSYTVGTVEGGTVAGSVGIYVGTAPTSHCIAIGTLKGGTNATAYGIMYNPPVTYVISAIDDTATAPGLGFAGLQLSSGNLRTPDLAGTGITRFANTAHIVPVTNVQSGVSLYANGTVGTLHIHRRK